MILYELVYKNKRFYARKYFCKDRFTVESGKTFFYVDDTSKVQVAESAMHSLDDVYSLNVMPCTQYMDYARASIMCLNSSKEKGILLLVNIPDEFKVSVRSINCADAHNLNGYALVNSKDNMQMYISSKDIKILVLRKCSNEAMFETLCSY
ncbi:MAG: hypothetical protein RR751_02235 [Clostridia bacterium]